jgi:hypothetical protein
MVRARGPGHIESLFPDAEVTKTEDADYLYRAFLPRQLVATALADTVADIEYTNFKNSVVDRNLHDAYMSVWTIMYSFQRTLARTFRKPTRADLLMKRSVDKAPHLNIAPAPLPVPKKDKAVKK